jgi:hypothetical protein
MKSLSKVLAVAIGAATLSATAGTVLTTPASAQEWRYGEFRRFPGERRFGTRCMFRVEAEGYGSVQLFAGRRDKKRAMNRAAQGWQERVAAEFGPQWSSWELARGKSVSCNTRGLEIRCVASAFPCR